ncbi:unnamed protein product, partial [Closterium sp. NIES-54]
MRGSSSPVLQMPRHHVTASEQEPDSEPSGGQRNGLSVLGVLPKISDNFTIPIAQPPRDASPVRSVGYVFAVERPTSPSAVEPHLSLVLVPGGDEGSSRPSTASPSTVNSTPGKRPRIGVKYSQQRLWGAPSPKNDASPTRTEARADPKPPTETAEAEYAAFKHRYDTEWAGKFEWLRLHRQTNGRPSLKCSVCMKYGDPTACTSYGVKGEGGRDLQTGTIRVHSSTRAHKQVLESEARSLAAKEKQVTLTRWQETDASTRHIIRCLHIAMFVCKADAPIAMFVPLCWFLAKEGLPDLPPNGGYGAYYTDYGFKESLPATSACLQETQRLHFLESPWMSLSLDESTDRIHGKHLIIYVTYLKNRAVVNEFLTLITVDRADAASLSSAVVQYLTGIGVDLQKVTGIATDGASVMVGKNNGVVARLRMRIPHLASTHCIAHREALAAKDAVEAVPELNMIDDVVRAFSELIGRSGVQCQKFQNLQRVYCKMNLEAQGMHTVRWLSRGEAVARLLEVLPAAIVVLKNYKPDLYEVVTSFKFHWLLRFLVDILWELNHLNQRFQQRQIDVTLVAHIVEQTRMRLKARYLSGAPGHTFGSGEYMTLPDFFLKHQKQDKREMKVEGVDCEGNPVS